MQAILQEAAAWALEESTTYGSPPPELLDITNKKGVELAEKFSADKDIVFLGTNLMDIHLGRCIREGKIKEHVERSATAASSFLEKHNLSQEVIDKVLNAIKAHHGAVPFNCKEAEICANADCYRFLHPRGVLAFITMLTKRHDGDLEKIMHDVEAKADEKWGILTLDDCKRELEPYYKQLKDFLKKAREFS